MLFFKIYLFNVRLVTILWFFFFCHTLTWISHKVYMCPHILNPLPASLPIPSLWVVPKPWLWVPCFMHQACTALHVFASWCMFFARIELPHLVSFCFRYFDTILLVIYWVGLANNFEFFIGSWSESESCSVVSDSATPWTIKSMEFFRPEYWSR